MALGKGAGLVLTALGALALPSTVEGEWARPVQAQAGDGAAEIQELMRTLQAQAAQLAAQERALAEQARGLEAQRQALEQHQDQLRQLTGQAGVPATAGSLAAFDRAAAIPPAEADRLRGGQAGAGGAGTLEIRPPQQFFGRMRGEVVPVPPERLGEVGPEGEPPVPVFVPEEKREEFLRLREQLRDLVAPEPAPQVARPAPPEGAPEAEPAPPAAAVTEPQAPAQPAPPAATAAVPPAVRQPPRPPTGQVAALEGPEERPEIVTEVLAQSVLTPAGVLSFEPSIEYVHSSNNRFVFEGSQLVDTVLIGAIEATDADRDILTAAGTVRYGVTDRIEVDAKLPFVYRDDRINTFDDPDAEAEERSFDGYGLGDIELGGHYQITGLPPFLIGNLRVKTDTGDGPFDVERGPDGVETEAPTGSGFWSVEPSLTAIYPSEPAVFFGNIGYVFNIGRDVDTVIGTGDDAETIGDVDPGDAITGSLGMGFALNERASVSFGYEHNYILETETETTDVDGDTTTIDSETLQVGSFFFGGSYRLNDWVTLSSTVQVGATEDAPDVQLTLRAPIRFDVGRLFGS